MRTAYIGMGANLPSSAGSPEATIATALGRLARIGRIVARSSLYSTEPVGYADQPKFVNAVVAVETGASPREILDALMRIEKEFGRDRANAIPNGPRTLDLDVLLFGDCIIDEPGLRVPHPRLAERAFVLVPLNEIAPEATDPHSGATVAELLQRLPSGSAADAVMKFESNAWDAAAKRSHAGK